MSDEPFYSPNYRPPEAPRNRPAEPLWSLRVAGVTWSCALRFHGESYGWEAQILRDGELFMAHGAFPLKGDAIRWAEGRGKRFPE
jgi:hypothetical protein